MLQPLWQSRHVTSSHVRRRIERLQGNRERQDAGLGHGTLGRLGLRDDLVIVEPTDEAGDQISGPVEGRDRSLNARDTVDIRAVVGLVHAMILWI